MKIVEKYVQLPESETLKINTRANALRQEGKDVANFAAGEPDFNTPDYICEAAFQAIKNGKTKYTPATGTPQLKKAIAHKLREENHLEYAPEQIVISSGAKHALYNVIQVLCGPGDEVLIPAPYWVSYPAMVSASGAKSVFLHTAAEKGFILDPATLEKAITPQSKVLILNTPSNPTGCVYSADQLRKIAEIVVRHKLICLSDEIYEKLVYDGAKHISIASFNSDIYSRTVVVNGLSKSHAMTGWRIGYAAGNLDVMKAVARLQAHSTSNPCSVSQEAALAALQGPKSEMDKMVEIFNQRRKLMVKLLRAIPGMKVFEPQGAFYVMPNIESFFGKKFRGRTLTKSWDMVNYLLDEALAATVPGSAFGAEGFIRLSYATATADIEKGLARVAAALKE